MPLLEAPWYLFQLLEVAWPNELHCEMTWGGSRQSPCQVCSETGSKPEKKLLSSCQERQQSPLGTRAAECQEPAVGTRDKWSGVTAYMAEQRVQLLCVTLFILKNHRRWQEAPLWALCNQPGFSSEMVRMLPLLFRVGKGGGWWPPAVSVSLSSLLIQELVSTTWHYEPEKSVSSPKVTSQIFP